MHLEALSTRDGLPQYTLLQQIGQNENGFHNDVKDMPYDAFPAWLAQKAGYAKGLDMPDWMVPETTYWLYADDAVPVACGRVRHYLNETLQKDGGHIGYAVGAPFRGRGYGNALLRLLLAECEKLDIREAHIGANKDNVPSNRVILRNGGMLLRESDEKNYYIVRL